MQLLHTFCQPQVREYVDDLDHDLSDLSDLSIRCALFTGVNINQDQIWLVKIGEHIGFYVDRRS